MIKEETWSVSIQRARSFFREQEDVTEESLNVFSFRSCRIQLTELKPKGMGVWASKRIKVRMEGEDADGRISITVFLFNSYPPEVNI